MAIRPNGTAMRQLTTLLTVGMTGELSDGQLLERFATLGGEAADLAFGALVERHGPMVFRACRSVLRDEHEAHDAFQATFLVLAGKARALWVRDSLGPWLHSVAFRVARCAASSSERRRKHERRWGEQAARMRAGGGGGDEGELREAIHEEIERLPERYRAPVVLCDLEGRTHEQAARLLGWPVGTVKSRQSRGRDRLRFRLNRRGLAPSAALGVLLGDEAIGASVASASTNSMAHAATRVAAGSVAPEAGAVSARVAALTKEVLMGIALEKLKVAALALLAITLALAGAGGIAARVSDDLPGEVPAAAVDRKDVAAPRERTDKIYMTDRQKIGQLLAFDPRTGARQELFDGCNFRLRVSPDGRAVAFERDGAVWVRSLSRDGGPRQLFDLEGATFGAPPVWSRDGSQIVASLGRRDEVRDVWLFTTLRINVDGSGRTELKIPPEDGVQDWSADGRWLLTTSSRNAEIGWQLYVMRPDGTDLRQITEGGNPWAARFSPDGRSVLYTDGTTEERRGIWVVDFDAKDRRRVFPVVGKERHQLSACWSPDGKQIAVVDFDLDRGVDGPESGRLTLIDLDGANGLEIPLGEMHPTDMPDWR